MKTYKLSINTLVICSILMVIVPFLPGLILGYSLGFDSGWDNCLKQVMRTRNSDQFERLSPDVKVALSQMERAKTSATIAGAGHEGQTR